MSTLFDTEDDIFARPPRRITKQGAVTARITCRVCGLPSEVTISNPALLCNSCRIDIEQTKAHVESVLSAVFERWQAAMEAWEKTVAPHADRWLKIEEARLSDPPLLFLQRWTKTKRMGGEFAGVLTARELLDELSDELNQKRTWAAYALQEIDAYEQA